MFSLFKFAEVFDVNASASEDGASDVHESAKPAASHVNPLAINKSSSAAQVILSFPFSFAQ